MSAVNKLIYEDKVQFIITDTMYPGAVFAETEKNKVVALTGCPIPTMFDPTYKYTFQGGTMMQATPEVAGWIAKNTPEIKTVDLAFPDEAGGIGYAMGVQATLEAYGIKVNPIKYPVAVDRPQRHRHPGEGRQSVRVHRRAVTAPPTPWSTRRSSRPATRACCSAPPPSPTRP